MTASFGGDPPAFVDTWLALNPEIPHPPTAGVHLDNLPRSTLDFVFATEDLVPLLKSIAVEARTTASDHQPVIVEFD